MVPDCQRNTSLTETTAADEIVWPRGVGLPPLLVMSSDYVPAVHLPFWPSQASDWIIRSRVFPPHDTIQSIADEGCQVVPRTSVGGDVHTEWRLSFSRAEATLAKLRSKEQQETYYFFKNVLLSISQMCGILWDRRKTALFVHHKDHNVVGMWRAPPRRENLGKFRK